MPGILDYNGRKLAFRPSPTAAANFGLLDTSTFTNSAVIPRPKFLFYARFVRSTDANGAPSKLNTPGEGIVFQIKSMDLPKFTIKNETLNQYNKPRIIQTKVDFQALSIEFHDDVGDKVLNFWTEYFGFYYGDGKMTSTTDWHDDIVKNQFNEGSGGGWGYRGKFGASGGADSMHFLESIEVFRFYGKMYNVIKFVHPKIISFDHDGNDYAEGREGSGIRMQFEYEGVIYDLTNKNINDAAGEGIKTQFNFRSDYYDPQDIPGSTTGTPATQTKKETDIDPYAGLTLSSMSVAGSNIFSESLMPAESYAGSSSILPNTTFGTDAFAIGPTDFVSLSSLTSTPSPDLIEKATGVKSKIDSFGSEDTSIDWMVSASNAINTGANSAKIDQASAMLGAESTITEQRVGPGQTKATDSTVTNAFSRSLGTASVLAENRGLIDSTSSPTTDRATPASAEEPTLINTVKDGFYRLTNSGAAVMNSLRSPMSSLGTKTVGGPFEDPDNISAGKRALSALTGGLYQ